MPISRPFERWFAAAILLLACLVAGLSGANAQGKRLGLVVGLAEYGETRHPTALQDASLVAQALKQAGFDLVEGANLSQNELRAILRDFADKVGAAGPDALVAVYVAGVGVQDDGENILIPAGARLRQKSDLGIEGLRIDDMLRVIGSMPASARIVMLDAAYAHPYAQLVADGGRGLAPIEKRDGMLVAYNHSPNQTIELPRTNYGAYAMALAEVLAEPGLELGAIFDRVRLRVHDQSQGLQTPSDVNGLTQPIVLVAPVAAAGTAPPLPAPAPRRPIAELSADEAYGRAVEIDSIKGYEEFLRAYPDHPQAKRVRAMIASRREAYYWQRARRANTSRAYWTYLKRYPNGAHAGEAEARLARLSAPVEPPADFEEVIYDDLPPPPPAEIEIYETVVVEDNWGVLPPPPGFGIIGLPPPPLAIIDLPPPPPPAPSQKILPAVVIGAGVIGAAILANRMWKRPATVRPPVAPPIVRPVRPIGVGPRPGQIMPVGPGGGQPPLVGPRPGPGQIMPGGGVVRPGQPPVVPGGRPGVVGQPPVVPPGQPNVVRPGQPPVTPPGQPNVVRPGQPPVVPGGRPGVVGQPPVVPPGQPNVVRPGQPPVTPPGQPNVVRPGQPPVTPPGQPNLVRPVQPHGATSGRPVIGAPPQVGPSGRPVIGTPPNPGGRQRPVITPQRPAPPVLRPAPPTVRPVAPVARPAQPVVRQPQPVIRQAPPVVRQPPPRPAPAYRPPPPAVRAAPPPAARPAAPLVRPPAPAARPAPAPRPCTPQMRAARQC